MELNIFNTANENQCYDPQYEYRDPWQCIYSVHIQVPLTSYVHLSSRVLPPWLLQVGVAVRVCWGNTAATPTGSTTQCNGCKVPSPYPYNYSQLAITYSGTAWYNYETFIAFQTGNLDVQILMSSSPLKPYPINSNGDNTVTCAVTNIYSCYGLLWVIRNANDINHEFLCCTTITFNLNSKHSNLRTQIFCFVNRQIPLSSALKIQHFLFHFLPETHFSLSSDQ